VIVGVTSVIVSIAKDKLNLSCLWKIGFLLVFLGYTVCLALFIIRGYYMWCMEGDPATHIGLIKETLNTGHVSTSVIYPLTQIYLSEIVFFTDLDLIFWHKIVPLIFGLLCILFMYVLAKTIFINKSISLLVALISCCLVYSWYLRLTPNILANFFLPFILFLVYKNIYKKTWTWAIALIIALVVMPVFHTVPTMILAIVFISICALAFFSYINKYSKTKCLKHFKNSNYRVLIPFFIMVIWWIFWLSLFSVFNHQLLSVYEAIVLEGGDSWLNDLMDTTSTTAAYGYNVIEQIMKNLWSQIILCAISALSLPLMIKEFFNARRNIYAFSLLLAFAAVIPLSIGFYLFHLAFTPQRLLYAISMFGTLFTAYVFSFFLTNIPKRYPMLLNVHVRSAFVIVVIFGLFIGGLLALYPSPYILSSSWQNTQSEAEGMLFVYGHRDVTVPLTGISVTPGRFSHAFLTKDEQIIQKLPLYLGNQHVPYHFGYDINFSMLSVYTHETDIIITKEDERMYIDTLPEIEMFRYTQRDFSRLMIDPGLQFLYSNGEFKYFKVSV